MAFEFSSSPSSVRPEVQVVKLNGRLMDKNEAASLLEHVEELALDGRALFLINLSKLEYMNSSGLNVLVSLLTKARNEGGEAVITNVSPKVQELFIITKLNTVFSVTEDEEAAFELLAQASE